MSAVVLTHLHLSWLSNIRHSALISSLLEILSVSGSLISGHAHTWCAPTKSGRLHGSVQTCDCTHCITLQQLEPGSNRSSVSTEAGQQQGVGRAFMHSLKQMSL